MAQAIQEKFIRLHPHRQYSDAFKRKVVREIDAGLMTKEGARRRYRILGHSTVHRWYRQHSNFASATLTVHLAMGDKPKTQAEQRALIRDLERALAHSELKNFALETMIDLAEATYKIDVRKNSGAKQLPRSNSSDPVQG